MTPATGAPGGKRPPLTRFVRFSLWNGLLFAVILGGMITRAMQLCHGHFGYPMDDTYIHMAMAKSFALHGVWGVTQYAFSSSTSSPLFTLLLAVCYWATGVHEVTPLVVNVVLSAAVIAALAWVFWQTETDTNLVKWAMPALVLSIPLPIMALSGMEHVLQILLVLVFTGVLCPVLLARDVSRAQMVLLVVYSLLLVATRYEDSFLVLTGGLLLFARRMIGTAIGIGVASALPIGVYGWISLRHGWYFFPTSLLLKANLPAGGGHTTLSAFVAGLTYNVTHAPHMVFLMAAAGGLLWAGIRRREDVWTSRSLALILFLGTASLHMCMARVGWYFRYEAYLVALGGVACVLCLQRLGIARVWSTWKIPATVLACALLFTLGFRTVRSIYLSPTGIRNIYDQQYHSGLFVQKYFPQSTVVVNDIGAVSFLSDAHVLDVEGLGSVEAARAKFQGAYSPEWLKQWGAREGAVLAILYPHFGPPPEWGDVATWTIPDNWIAGRSSVSVYAADPRAIEGIRADLRAFRTQLSPGVTQVER